MSDMVEKLYADYEKRVAKKEKKKKVKEEDNASVNHGIGGDPPEPPSPSSSSISSSSSSHSHHSYSSFHPSTSKNPLLKLDVKFNFPMFNGEANADKLNNWIRQIKVYCHVQQIEEEEARSSWLLFGWKAQPLFGGRENFRKVVSIMVNSFLHGLNLHLH
jgi:hypothetical protein